MKKKLWKSKIKKACTEAGTYKPYFDTIIDTLAGMMERRDLALEEFAKMGNAVTVKHTNKNGSVNLEQNPALRMVNDYNRDTLAYWRELGLTPAGFKRLNGGLVDPADEKKGLADVLSDLGI